ncbi:YitT family protein [Carnobacterium divergens]|nr:YitT family protein [Carnobacterium divergens]MDT1941530.1 YitT family protein [Carnobacterium divergens]MDT1947328.1 YitT family protein [Carnobacterium divergens]MDT1949767.1 YitT family protein [Carnobacterium divergens]MDT1954945.1 YitT family protein [Carnobacterium divergens]
MKKKIVESPYTMKFVDVLLVIVGAFFIALSMNVFLIPNQIVSGGVSGLSIALNSVFGWSPSAILYVVNVPLLVLCFFTLGYQSGIKTILGSLLLPTFVGLLHGIEPWTEVPLLAAIFGGVMIGIGLGLVFRGNASTGGTAILSQIMNKYLKIPMGACVGIIDGMVVLSALLVFDLNTVMYSLISLFIISRVIDLVQVGVNRSKNIFIISEKSEMIRLAILNEVDRGVTNVAIKGGYGNTDKEMLMCVIPEREFNHLKETVLVIDPHAFVVVTSASEVMGRGFSLLKELE